MPKPLQYALTWSETHQHYELYSHEQREHCFRLEDEPAFSHWLESYTRFAFVGKSGVRLTVIKEARSHGSGYWYAYRKQDRRTRKRYLGPSTRVTLALLEEQTNQFKSSYSFPDLVKEPIAPSSERKDVLFSAKLSAPRLPSFLVERTLLLKDLDAVRSHALTLVSASAGSGKTTLLSAWATTSGGPGRHFGKEQGAEYKEVIAWLSLDILDNDPIRLWSSIIAALHTSLPQIGQKSLAMLHSLQPLPFSTFLTSLLYEIQDFGQEIILILDDYHLIEDQTSQETMGFFLDHLPVNLHVVISTRTDPELPLSRFRVRGQLVEIRSSDLRFTREEATRFLVQNMGLPLTEDDVAILSKRTEGWIAGLHLAALSLRKRQNLSGLTKNFAGSYHFVLDYVHQDILARLPIPFQHFLLQTSVLTNMNAAVCQAVTMAGELQECQHMLVEAERANLFVVPLDMERQWYRFHDLFRDVLLARLYLTQPELVPLLHKRAACWYEKQGILEEAIAHALEAGDESYAVLLLTRFVVPQSWRNEYHTLRRFLQRLPPGVLATQPDLSLHLVIALILTSQRGPGTLELVEEPLQWAEQGYREHSNQAGIGAVLTTRAVLLAQKGDILPAFALAHQTLNLLPEQESMWRGHCLSLLGMEAIFSGQVVQAGQFLRPGLALYEASGSLPGTQLATVMLGEVSLNQGDLHVAARTFQRVLATPNEQPDLHQSQLVLETGVHERHYERMALYDLAALAYEWNNLGEAERLLQEARAGAMPVWFYLLTPGLLFQVRLLSACAKFQQAQDLLNELAAHQPRPEILREIAFCQAWLAMRRGNLVLVHQWASSRVEVKSCPLIRREEEMLLLVRLRITEGQPETALDLLTDLAHEAPIETRKHSALQILLLKAVAHQSAGEHVQAKEHLLQACWHAWSEGYQRLFLDEGKGIEILLKELLHEQHEQPIASYLRILLRAFASTLSSENTSRLPESLTPQEQRVLHLLADGASNQAIASQLIVSLTTAKKHVANILSKLGAQNRTQAVALAREYALL